MWNHVVETCDLSLQLSIDFGWFMVLNVVLPAWQTFENHLGWWERRDILIINYLDQEEFSF